MKENKYKIAFLSLLVLVICTGVFFIIKKSFAYGEDVIYTRDELSEKVESLESENESLRLKNNTILVGTPNLLTLNPNVETQATLSLVYNDNEDLFSISGNSVIIKKTGKYLRVLHGFGVFSGDGYAKVYDKRNNVIGIGDFSLVSNRTHTLSTTHVDICYAGEIFTIFSSSTVSATSYRVYESFTYMGE